ncbi:MAG: energy transducer TonB [Myxococcales bacterium]|nr:energy transducer TonB [Myxococcales bacterium]
MRPARRPDPLAREPGSTRGRTVAVVVLASVAAHSALVGGFAVSASLEPDRRPDESLVWVEIAEPAPEVPQTPEPAPAEPAPPEVEPEVEVAVAEPPEPEPELAPPPDRPAARPDPTPPRDEPPTPPPVVETRPISIGLAGESFSNGAGPVFGRGDTARGGRPDRTSVDPNDERVATATPPAQPAMEPAPEAPASGGAPSRTRRPPRDRDPRLRTGVLREAPYPDAARGERVEADCIAQMRIGATGEVESIDSIRCTDTTHGFEESIRAHVQRAFRFDPAIEGGVPVERSIRWQFEFRLDP